MLKLLGVFAECNTEEDQKKYARQNVFLFYELGVFATLVQLLSMEIEYVLYNFMNFTVQHSISKQ